MAAGTINLEELSAEMRAELAATDEAALETWRVTHLGRKGTLTSVLRRLGSLEMEEGRRIGGEANKLKIELEAALEAKLSDLQDMTRGLLVTARERAEDEARPDSQTIGI